MDKNQGEKRIRKNQRRSKPKAPINWADNWQHWKQKVVHIAVFFLCFGVLFVGGRALNESLRVTQWNIDASPSIVKEMSRVLQVQKLDFWHTRPMFLRQQLLNGVPDLADVLIQRQLPDTLNIHVRLCQRMGLWENEHGVVYLVDEDGVAYRALKNGENVNLPMLRMPKKYLQAASEILQTLQASSGKWFALSSEVFTDGLDWKLNFNQRQQWLLPFGAKAVHNIALLSKVVDESPWHAKKWRVNTRMGSRWFFREANLEEVI